MAVDVEYVKNHMKHNDMKSKLKVLMKSCGFNQSKISEILGVTYQTVSIKMNGNSQFTLEEIVKISRLLEMDADMIYFVFFDNEEVTKEDAEVAKEDAEVAKKDEQ